MTIKRIDIEINYTMNCLVNLEINIIITSH